MEIKRPVTNGDMYNMPKDGRKYEFVDGEIVVSPGNWYHAEIATKISHIIATFLEDHPIGKVYGDNVGIIFPNGNLRSPNAFFVRKEKLPDGRSPATFGEMIPDLAVEVLSPNDSMKQLAQKIGEFLECGVPIVWLVDPVRKTVTVYRSLSETEQYSVADTLTSEPVLPGFSCLVSRFF